MTLLYLAVAFMAGIVLGRSAWDAGMVSCAFPGWLWIVLVCVIPLSALLNRYTPEADGDVDLRWPRSAGFRTPRTTPSLGVCVAVGLCVAAGFARYAARPLYPCLGPADVAYWNAPYAGAGNEIAPIATVTGFIASYPSLSDTTQRLDVRARELVLDGVPHPVEGDVRLNTSLQEFSYGQPVRVVGALTDPFPGDDGAYADYLARRGVRSQIQRATVTLLPLPPEGTPLLRVLYRVRSRGEQTVNRILPAPYASVANGMLLGIEAGIPDELMDQFHATGTSHVIVISGSNIALIAGVLAGFFARLLGKRRAWIPVILGIAAYALLVGGDMAVLRAALMGGLAALALGLGRRGTGIISLAAACWMLVMINPLTFFDAGFQLSAAATAGLILFTAPLARIAARFWPGWIGGPISSPFLVSDNTDVNPRSSSVLRGLFEDTIVVSLAATIAVTPLIAYAFGRVSVTGMLANVLITPVQPLITVAGSAGALSGAFGAVLPARLLLWAAWPGLFWTVEVVERVAALPFASVETVHYGLEAMILTYAVMGIFYWRRPILKHVPKYAAHLFPQTRTTGIGSSALLVSGLVALLVWWATAMQPDGRVHLYFLDVGQGDGIFIESPSGRQVLVDGGSSPQALLGELGEVMPFWDRSLDLVLLTHPDGDHMDAQTYALQQYTVGQAITQEAVLASNDAVEWRNRLASEGVPVTTQQAGGWIDLGDGVALWVLNPAAGGYVGPDPDNENSIVVKVVYGDFSALLTGDAGLVTEGDWLADGAPVAATVLKVGHHGSRTSTSAPFVAYSDPRIAIIQVGSDNRYGHPHADVMQNLAGRIVLRNDRDGRIHVASDGHQVWWETELDNRQTQTLSPVRGN